MPTIYKENDSRFVYPIDTPAWLAEGWTLTPQISKTNAVEGKVNLNTASVEELRSLKITVAMAKKIIDGRPYQSLDDLPEGFDFNAIATLIEV